MAMPAKLWCSAPSLKNAPKQALYAHKPYRTPATAYALFVRGTREPSPCLPNGDKWYYFFWGMNPNYNVLASIAWTPPTMKLLEITDVGNYDLRTTAGVAAAVSSVDPNRAGNITDSFYYTGDFSNTYTYLSLLQKTKPGYNLLLNNCVEQSTIALSVSDPRFLYQFSIIPNHTYSKKAFWERFVPDTTEKAKKFLERKGIL